MSGGEINFTIRANNENFLRALREAQAAVDQTVSAAENGGKDIDSVLSKLGQFASMTAIAAGVQKFVSQMVQVRSEFQAADTAIQTLLGSKEKADELMSKVREFAQISPLEFSDVTQATQMMLGFNIEAEKIPRFLQAIGDVSMGNTNQFNSLTLAFSQMSATGKLMGQDLNQMINAGFNPLQQMAKTTGKSISELKDEMSKGAISAEMVQQAFVDATSAGGQFYQMSENASKTIQGQISMLEDAMSAAFNELGKQSEGLIMKGISGATTLVENYEKVGAIVASLAASYGTYRTALIVATIAEKAHTTSLMTAIKATRAAAVAQAALNAVVKANPYVLLATAVVGVATAIWALHDSSTAAEKAEKAHHKAIEDVNSALENRRKEAEDCIRVVQDETETITAQVTAYNKLKTLCPELTRLYDIEALSVLNLADAQKVLNEERDKSYKSSVIQGLNESTEKIQRLEKELEDYNSEDPSLARVSYSSTSIESKKKQLDEQIEIRKKYQADLKKIEEAEKQAETKTENKTSYTEAFNKAKAEYDVARKAVEDAKKGTAEDYTQAVAELEKKEKAFKDLGGTTFDKSSKTAEDLRKETDQYLTLIDQQALEMKRGKEDLWNQVRNAEISAMKDGSAKTLAEMEQQYKERKQAIERQQEDLLRSRISDAKTAFEANPSNKGKSFDGSGISLTSGEIESFKKLYNSLDEERAKQQQEYWNKERSSLNEYLIEYGTFTQKKTALEEEYAKKVEEATTYGEKMSLQAELKSKLSDLTNEEFSKSVNWEGVFNDLDNISLDYLQRLKERLKDALNNKDISADNAKVIAERINEIDKQISSRKSEWKNVFGVAIPELEKIRQQEQDIADAQAELAKAQERYNAAVMQAASAKQDIAMYMQQNGVSVADPQSITARDFQQYADIFNRLGKNTDELANKFQGLSSSEKGLETSTQGLASAQSGAEEAAASSGSSMASTVAIIDAIVHGINDNVQAMVDLLDQLDVADTKFGKGFQSFAESSKYASQAWESLKSGDFIGVATGVVGSLKTLGDALGKWGIAGFGYSDSNLADDLERLTASNENLKNSIDVLADKMEDSESLADIESIYEKQKEYLQQSIANTQESMIRTGAVYNNGFLGIGGAKSSNYKIDKAISSAEWERVSSIVGQTVNSAGDFWKLTSEQMSDVSAYAADIYDKIKQAADDGVGDVSQFMDAYIDYYKQLDELESARQEKLTNITFDSITDEFSSALEDMDSDAEDFTDNFEDMIRSAIVNSMMVEKYKSQLEKWYKTFSNSMTDGTLTDDELSALRSEYDSIVKDALEERKNLIEAIGLGSSSSSDNNATSGGFQTMSQDSADELNGRFTALQMSGEEIKRTLAESAMYQYQLVSLTTDGSTTLNNILYQHVVTNAYLEDITIYTKKMAGFSSQLDKMNDKLDKL